MSLKIFISGYGPFMNIKVNPADELAQQIEKSWDRAFKGVNIELVRRVTLPVKVPDVDALLADWKAEIAKLTEEDPNNRFLCIHIGVNAGIEGSHIEFERFCNNRRIMDDAGAFYEEGPAERVCTDKLPNNHRAETNFDIEKIVSSVGKFNPWAQTNYDPGDYLCNFIYLQSVIALQCDTTNSFFLHIPDDWNSFHFEKETVYQFILRYAGLYHPRLCFVPSKNWNLQEGDLVDPLVSSVPIETVVNLSKVPTVTQGTLTLRFGHLSLIASEGEGSAVCLTTLEDENGVQGQEAGPAEGNLQNLDFNEEEIEWTVTTGQENFAVAVTVNGEDEPNCFYTAPISALMNVGENEVEFGLKNEAGDAMGDLKVTVIYGKSWC